MLELIRRLNPAILSIDARMPNIDADGLLALLAEKGFPGNILIVSGQDSDTLRAVANNDEMLGLVRPKTMQKPINIQRLRQLLGNLWKEIKPQVA